MHHILRLGPITLFVLVGFLFGFLGAFAPQKGGEILVELCKENSESLVLKVEDDGVGFPAELDFRNTETLGLQLVAMLVEQLKGEIELESSNGSRFQIIFPNQIK